MIDVETWLVRLRDFCVLYFVSELLTSLKWEAFDKHDATYFYALV